MELKVDSSGDVLSDLPSMLGGRSLDLKGGAHPNQVIASSWRNLSSALTELVDELEALPWMAKPNESKATEKFRQLTYAATELFDAYTQLLPDRLGLLARADKKKLKDYRDVATRATEICKSLVRRVIDLKCEIDWHRVVVGGDAVLSRI